LGWGSILHKNHWQAQAGYPCSFLALKAAEASTPTLYPSPQGGGIGPCRKKSIPALSHLPYPCLTNSRADDGRPPKHIVGNWLRSGWKRVSDP